MYLTVIFQIIIKCDAYTPTPKIQVSFYLYICCFWINFESIKRKIQGIIWNCDLMLMLERPRSHYWTSPLKRQILGMNATCFKNVHRLRTQKILVNLTWTLTNTKHDWDIHHSWKQIYFQFYFSDSFHSNPTGTKMTHREQTSKKLNSNYKNNCVRC